MGANDALVHSQSGCFPKIFPIKGDVAPADIDRAQSLDPKVTLNREKVEELGRILPVDYIKGTPTVGCSLAQKEYGSLDFFRKITNVADSVTKVTLEDFRTPYFDIATYLEDDDGNFRELLQRNFTEIQCYISRYKNQPSMNHSKILLFDFPTAAFVVESSANLRSCNNLEQFCLTQSRPLLEFHRQWISRMLA